MRFKNFIKLCKDYSKKPFLFIVNDIEQSKQQVEQSQAQCSLDRQTTKNSVLHQEMFVNKWNK